MASSGGGSLIDTTMRLLAVFRAKPVVFFAVTLLVLAVACGRTELSGSGSSDGGIYQQPGVDGAPPADVTTRDRNAPDVRFGFNRVVWVDVSYGIDSPVHLRDAGRDTGHDASACGDGTCDDGETCSTCPLDCGWCRTCGDGTCDPGETCSSCPQDCGSCATCPDGYCDDGETCLSCPADCGVCPTCGDGKCNGTENCTNCPADCGQCAGCGDGACSPSETCVSCPADCGTCAFCGNGKCESSEGETCNSCPEDCGQCPIATTCSQILTCEIGCFTGGFTGISASCIADCDANACTQAAGLADNAINCMLQAVISRQCSISGGGGVGSILQCLQQACAAPIAACMGMAPCPGADSGN